jgi:hypothetical protein
MVCATEVDTATCRFVPLRLVFRSNRTKKQPPLKPDIPNHSPRLFPISLSINIFLTEDWNAGYREDPSISCSKAPLSEIFKQLTAQHLVLTHSLPSPDSNIPVYPSTLTVAMATKIAARFLSASKFAVVGASTNPAKNGSKVKNPRLSDVNRS